MQQATNYQEQIIKLQEELRQVAEEKDQLNLRLTYLSQKYWEAIHLGQNCDESLSSLGPFGIIPNIHVKLKILDNIYDGATNVLAEIENLPIIFQGNENISNFVQLSVIAKITLVEDGKNNAKIPETATFFAFSYPLCGISELNHIEDENLKSPLFQFLYFGGFVYFSDSGEVIQANALVQGNDLFFEGPFYFKAEFTSFFRKNGLFFPVNISELWDKGAREFCWIPSGKQIKMENSFSTWEGNPPWKNGAFLYYLNDKSYVYFIVKEKHNNEEEKKNEQSDSILNKSQDLIPFSILSKQIAKNKLERKKSFEDPLECMICMTNQIEVLFLPCKHLICCKNCSNQIKTLCPKCRRTINQKLEVFF